MSGAHSIIELASCASRHIDDYTARDGGRAFWTYDRDDGAEVLTPLDCLAPVLLSVRTSYRDVIPLFAAAGPHAELLGAMNLVLGDPRSASADFLDLDLDDRSTPWGLVRSALGASEPVPNLTAVYVTKVLHRKLPLLVPLYDSVVYRFYMGKAPSGRHAPTRLFAALQRDVRDHRDWLADLANGRLTSDGRPLSVLRATDIAIWQHVMSGCAASA